MSLLLLYGLLLKATVTSFSGLASLPIIRADFVERYAVLTDRQLNTAVAAGRSGPGPIGAYVVSVGYQVRGWPGAAMGWLAMITPAFLIVPMLRFLGARASHRRARGAIRGVLLASAALLAAATIPLGRDALTSPQAAVFAVASFLLLAFTRLDTVWVILGSAAAGALGALL